MFLLSTYYINKILYTAVCEQAEERGPCEGSFRRWHFNKETDSCEPFVFGGCKGNKNNFVSEEACKYQCKRPGVRGGKIDS